MNILQNLFELYNHLPYDSTYRSVIRELLKNLGSIENATIYDMAEMTSASRTTIWRMIQKMGYKTYSEFHHELSEAVEKYAYLNRIINIKASDSVEVIANKYTDSITNSAQLIREYIDLAEIERLADFLHSCHRISFYMGVENSRIQSFQQNLSMDGKDTGAFYLLPDMICDADTLDDNCMAFLYILEFAEAINANRLIQKVMDSRCKICILNNTSRYYDISDFNLLKPRIENSPQNLISSDVYMLLLSIVSDIYRKMYIDL